MERDRDALYEGAQDAGRAYMPFRRPASPPRTERPRPVSRQAGASQTGGENVSGEVSRPVRRMGVEKTPDSPWRSRPPILLSTFQISTDLICGFSLRRSMTSWNV